MGKEEGHKNMGFGNVIFPELHNWALATGCSAAPLIVSIVFLLIVKRVYHRNLHWQKGAISLLMIGIGIWSFIIALNGYQQWLDIVHHAPVHGLIAYAHAINANYIAGVLRSQIQFAVVVVLLVAMLCMLCWEILSHVLHASGHGIINPEVQQ
jgi:hypothetical protein